MSRTLMAIVLSAGVFAAGAASITTSVNVLKDGEVSATAYSGADKDLAIDGGSVPVAAWITFQSDGVDLSGTASVALYVRSVDAPGALQVRLLTAPVTNPEIHVALGDLSWAADTAALVHLSTASVETVIKADISAALRRLSGPFYGVAILSTDGLKASICSKEGALKPMLYLTHQLDQLGSHWLTGGGAPADSIGKKGDLYLDTTASAVYRKPDTTWLYTANIRGADGTNGANGTNGTSIVWRGSYLSLTRYSANDVVAYKGSSYITTAALMGTAPDALGRDNAWSLLARAGTSGTSSWTDGTGIVSTTGNVSIEGDLAVTGTISGKIDVSQVKSLPGQGYTVLFPDVFNNLARIEITNVAVVNKVVILTGPGFDIDRTIVYGSAGHRFDESGFSMEHPFIFEASGADTATLKTFFNTYSPTVGPRSMSMLTDDVQGQEFGRMNFFEMKPVSYAAGTDGRVRFTWACTDVAPNATLRVEWAGGYSYSGYPRPSVTPGVDKGIEISEITQLAAPVEVDTVNLTVSIPFSFGEVDMDLWNWAVGIARNGTTNYGRKAMSVIDLQPATAGGAEWLGSGYDEVRRVNYFETFPVRIEFTGGYALGTKITGRIVIAYGWRELG